MLFFTLLITILWIIVYFTLFFLSRKIQPYPSFQSPVSVIIAAKNEADNLSVHLPKILSQQYPEFEVIIAVNQTTDNTLSILRDIQQDYPHLRWVEIKTIPENLSPKKYALAHAIQEAKHEYILCTDADCIPNTPQWIASMMSPFAFSSIEIVLGYSPYQQENTLLNSFIQYETLLTAIQYLGLARLGMPYMGVGRNLAYKKTLFQRYNFDNHKHILSGDDDLLVNQAANSKNTAIQSDKLAWVYSIPKKNWHSWYKQKSRHITTGKHYKHIHLIILSIIGMFNFILPFLPFLYFIVQKNFYIFALPLMLMYAYTFVLFRKYHVKPSIAHFFLLPYMYNLYQIVFSIKGIFTNKNRTW